MAAGNLPICHGIRWTIPWWRQRPLNKRPDDLDPAPRRSWDIGRTLASGRPNLDVVRHSVTEKFNFGKKQKKRVCPLSCNCNFRSLCWEFSSLKQTGEWVESRCYVDKPQLSIAFRGRNEAKHYGSDRPRTL